MTYTLHHGDCLDIMPTLAAGSVDAIITDLPYGTTACAWDTIIPFVPMWEQVKRVLKPNGVFVTTASQPFTSALVMSNLEWYRYDYVWNKLKAANFLFGNNQPLKKTEYIHVFYGMQPTYNPIKTKNTNGRQKSGRKGIGNTIHQHLPNAPKRSMAGKNYEDDMLLPDNIIEISKPSNPIHPTQKPVALYEYLIRTHTNPGETVLDFCFGSCTTGVAALRTQRAFIGIERELDYFEIGQKRMKETALQPPLFVDVPTRAAPPIQASFYDPTP